jgi:hypothetical protein
VLPFWIVNCNLFGGSVVYGSNGTSSIGDGLCPYKVARSQIIMSIHFEKNLLPLNFSFVTIDILILDLCGHFLFLRFSRFKCYNSQYRILITLTAPQFQVTTTASLLYYLSTNSTYTSPTTLTMVQELHYNTISQVIESWEELRRIKNYEEVAGAKLFEL